MSPVNQYFNFTTHTGEQGLTEDLIIEAIQIHGHDAYYVKRDDVDIDQLLGEDSLAKYATAWPVEIYIKSIDAFAGRSEMFSKFGVTIEDQCTFVVAVRRFNQVTSGALVRPRENDLIYIQMTPTNRYLFEIRFVEDKEQLFQLGKLYTYELRCEMMNFGHERVQTNIPELNNVATTEAYTLQIGLGAGAGTYTDGETVYQGTSFIDAGATGTVLTSNSSVLVLQNITGTFGNTENIVGVTSNASYAVLEAPETDPSVADPLADNLLLADEAEDIIVVRGSNPLTNG